MQAVRADSRSPARQILKAAEVPVEVVYLTLPRPRASIEERVEIGDLPPMLSPGGYSD